MITNRTVFRDYVADTVASRGLILQLTIRNIVVKYKNSLLGILWALLEPVATLLIFGFIFGVIARIGLRGGSEVPYSLIVISGIVCWQFFALNIDGLANSLVSGEHILKKVYFPHIVLSLSASLAILTEFFIIFICFCAALLIYQVPLTWRALWAAPIILHIYLIALGPGLCIAALNIRYRDFKHLVPIVLRLGFYLSPVGYPLSLVLNQDRFGEWVVYLYSLNPMVGAINMFRWVFFGEELYVPAIVASIAFAVLFTVVGAAVFVRNEAQLVDNI